jgi:hypothetical protein
MSSKRFYEWKKLSEKKLHKSKAGEKISSRRKVVENKEERKKGWKEHYLYRQTKNSYEMAIQFATEDWMLANDGVVTGLRYNGKKQEFLAKVNYTRDGDEKEEQIVVSDEWIIETYGSHLFTKLMDRRLNHEFLKYPPSKKGKLAMVRLGDEIVERIKYCASSKHWKGQLATGKVVILQEEFISKNFVKNFIEECEKLGDNKFVPIPVGSSRKSLMSLFPALKCKTAPQVKYRQGDNDACVFCSLASAFYCTKIPTLVTAANVLVMKSNIFGGGVQSLLKAKQIVEENARWLQPKKLTNNFNWEEDITRNMFVVGVLKDSGNSQQHAVTIFRNWIFDSNEPFALPLTKKNLDICTWEVKDDNVIKDSLFVSFCGGWIFYEHEDKKKKILDHCDLK